MLGIVTFSENLCFFLLPKLTLFPLYLDSKELKLPQLHSMILH